MEASKNRRMSQTRIRTILTFQFLVWMHHYQKELPPKVLAPRGVTLSVLRPKCLKLLKSWVFNYYLFFAFRRVEGPSLCLGPHLGGLCGFFLASPTLFFSFLVVINKLCHVLGAGHILQHEYCFLTISFYSAENPFRATKSNS